MAVGCVTFSLIIGGTVNKAVLQESCAQLDTTVLCLGRGSSSAELRGSVRHISWGEARTLPQGCTTIRLFLPSFYIASLPWLAAVWICPLKLREGPGGWMKFISYKQETGDTERICILDQYTEGSVFCWVLIWETGWWWLWPFPAKMRHSPASIWRIGPELEVLLSPGSEFSMIKISIPWEFRRISLKLSLDLHFKGDLEPDSQLFIF